MQQSSPAEVQALEHPVNMSGMEDKDSVTLYPYCNGAKACVCVCVSVDVKVRVMARPNMVFVTMRR